MQKYVMLLNDESRIRNKKNESEKRIKENGRTIFPFFQSTFL